MKYLSIALLLWSSVVFAAEAPIPKELIYQDYDANDGKVFSIKTTNIKHLYYWYVESDRCIATLKSKIITLKCEESDQTIVLKQQGTDIVMTLNGQSRAFMEGMLIHDMYWTILKHDKKH